MKKIFIAIFITSFVLMPAILLVAQTVPTDPGTSVPMDSGKIISNPLKVDSIAELLNAVLDIVVQIGVVVVTLGIIYSGFLLVKARGNPGEIKTARDSIIWTLIGAAIVLGAFVIAQIVQNTVDQLKRGTGVTQVDYQLINKS